MPAIDTATLLAVWENGRHEETLSRTLHLLAATHPERAVADWAQASIGERDRYLFELWERLFGDQIDVTATCPQCGERLEAEFAVHEITAGRTPQPHEATFEVAAEDYDVTFRLPSSRDLGDAADPSVTDGHAFLLERCIERASRNGLDTDPKSLPVAVKAAVTAEMSRVDSLAALDIAVTCSSCGHGWLVAFDIVEHLWGELSDWAKRLLREIHILASAYGWTEREILRLSSDRRRMYLDMLGA